MMMTSSYNSAKTQPGPFQKYQEALGIFSLQSVAVTDMMTSSCNSSPLAENDDKYTKVAKPLAGPVQKYVTASGKTKYHTGPVPTAPVFMQLIFKLQSVLCNTVPVLLGSSSFGFACMYMLLGLVYILLGGHPSGSTNSEKLLNLTSISMEVFGLLILRHKIQHRNSVKGVSGMTMLMYAACYTVRIWLNMPGSWSFNVMELELEASFGIFSLLLVLDCLRSVFVTHRSSYEEDLDVLHVKYLIPGCFLFAALLHAQFHSWSPLFGYMWTSCLYLDVLALMPQVVMMARGGGKVAAPIAHFVAATFLSRIEDLSDSLFFKAGTIRSNDYFSFYMIIFFQAMHLLIVMDFMYYYVKALTSGAGLEKDMDMNVMEV